MKIIYINDAGGVTILCPTPEALELYGIQAIAVKDVPAGKPFKIIEDADLPADREARDAWRVDPSELADGVGGESNHFEE